jgi:hypothetical protein
MRIGGASMVPLTCPTTGEVRSESPAMVPKMISFQLIRFIIDLLLWTHAVDSFYAADGCVHT